MIRYLPSITIALVVAIILVFPQVRRILQKLDKTKWLYLITCCYLVWSSVFIYLTSYVAIDGTRYFNLFDDAMISMRYAWNFSHGNGLVWNKGEYVEGITNLLQTLHMSIWTGLFDKSTAALMVQVVGIVIMLMIAYLTMKITVFIFEHESLANKNFYSILAFVTCLAYYPLSYWTLYGMETGLLGLLLLASVFYILRGVHIGAPISKVVPLLLGLSFIARPDAVIPAAAILLLKWYFDFTEKGRSFAIRSAIFDSLVVVALIGLVSLFRLSYYGSIFPNTFTLKAVGMPLGVRIRDGIIFIQSFLLQMAIPGCIVIGVLFIKKRIYLFLMFIIFLSTVIYQVWIGGDAWPYWRMMAPTVPIFFVLLLLSLDDIIKRLSPEFKVWNTNSLYHQYATLIFIFALMVGLNYFFLAEIVFYKHPYDVYWSWSRINTAVALNNIADPQATIAVTGAGTLPYYVDFRAIDILGKSDKYIASLPPNITDDPGWMEMSNLPGHNKYDLEYSIIQLQPSYARILQWGSDDVSNKANNYAVFIYKESDVKDLLMILNTNSPYIDWDKVEKTNIPLNDPRINPG